MMITVYKGEFIGMTQASRKEYEKDVKFSTKHLSGNAVLHMKRLVVR